MGLFAKKMTMFKIISKAKSIFLVLLLKGEVFPTFGSSNKYCCPKKVVNGITYILTDQTVDPNPSCINDCIYYVEDYPNNLLCFKEPECIPEISANHCPNGWTYFESKCYKAFFGSSIITWMDAQKSCREQGGDLAVIHDEETNAFVNNTVGGTRTWIGAFRNGLAPHYNIAFTWIDGRTMNFSDWSVNQPDNNGLFELCVHTNLNDNSGAWNDYDCWSSSNPDVVITNYVCQYDNLQ